MIIIEKIYILAALSLGIVTSISDIKEGRVYNKTLFKYILLGIVLDILYYGYFARDLFFLYVFNIGVLSAISLILFYTKKMQKQCCIMIFFELQ